MLSKLPQVPEDRSPLSETKKVIRGLGHYYSLLSDRQVWNSRKLKPYRRWTEEGQMEGLGRMEMTQPFRTRCAGNSTKKTADDPLFRWNQKESSPQ